MIHRIVDFIMGAFMDEKFFAILIPNIVALLIVGLNFLFNYWNKNREFEHSKDLKKLEIEQREKERKFRVGEKMIDKGIDAHMEAYTRVQQIFGFVNEYYSAEGTLVPPDDQKRKELGDLLVELNDWKNRKGFFLDKTVKQQIDSVVASGIMALGPGRRVELPRDIWEEMWRAINGLRDALETISKEYNPLYDLNVKLRKLGLS